MPGEFVGVAGSRSTQVGAEGRVVLLPNHRARGVGHYSGAAQVIAVVVQCLPGLGDRVNAVDQERAVGAGVQVKAAHRAAGYPLRVLAQIHPDLVPLASNKVLPCFVQLVAILITVHVTPFAAVHVPTVEGEPAVGSQWLHPQVNIAIVGCGELHVLVGKPEVAEVARAGVNLDRPDSLGMVTIQVDCNRRRVAPAGEAQGVLAGVAVGAV